MTAAIKPYADARPTAVRGKTLIMKVSFLRVKGFSFEETAIYLGLPLRIVAEKEVERARLTGLPLKQLRQRALGLSDGEICNLLRRELAEGSKWIQPGETAGRRKGGVT